MKFNYTLGVIGVGNMAKAILNGIVDAGLLDKSSIIATAPHSTLGIDGILSIHDNAKVMESSEYILLAVKPQVFSEIASELAGKCKAKHIISIMAGVDYKKLQEVFGKDVNITRVMPNTPCKIKLGMTAIANNDQIPASEREFVGDIFRSIGSVIYIDESLFHTITSVSGSGPAYVYMFIDGMIQSGVKNGLSYEDSKLAVLKTFEGAVGMVRQDSAPISSLIDMVCSKGGTTIQAVNSFREDGLYDTIAKAMDKCKTRSEELAK